MEYTTSTLSLLIGSVVISTLVTGLFAIMDRRRQGNKNYAVSDSRAIYDGLAKILEEVNACGSTEELLIHIKLFISPYGLTGNNDEDKIKFCYHNIQHDSFMWRLFDDIALDEKLDDFEIPSVFSEYKGKTSNFISLLIKKEKEKNKRAITSFSDYRIYLIVTAVSSIAMFIYAEFREGGMQSQRQLSLILKS